MSFLKSPLPRRLIVLAALSLGACSKTASPPTEFGVNVTVDATAIDVNVRSTITTATLTVVKAGTPPVVRTPIDLATALKAGTARFHYTPAGDGKPDAGIGAGDSLAFTVDVSDGTNLLASGSGSVTLAATAVTLKIELASATTDGGPSDGGGRGIGVACATDDECGSKFCTDGVCCNERCNDTCVSCNQADSKGMCKAYAAETDPEMECKAQIPTATGDEGDGGTDAEAGAGADADTSDAAVVNTPDGGFMTMPNKCGGACSGARACKYPGTETTCGTPFCNTHREAATFVCDGKGGCGTSVSECKDYSCDDTTGACRTTCSEIGHCLGEDYCSGNGACMAKKGNSISCTLPSECASGNCSGGVCCNTACDGQGLTCTEAGHVGQCQCQGVTCAAGVACQVFYIDADHDTYGDALGTIANGRAKAGCAGAPPTGFVADNTDCDDANSNAHPKQTMYFGTARANGTYDYDCSGSDDKLVPEYPGGVCRFCGPTTNCSATTTSCSGTAATGSFQCPLEGVGVIIAEPLTSASEPVTSPDLTSRVTIIPPPILRQCCGCATNDKSGFVAKVACGAYAYKHTCGACNGSTETADTQAYTQQTCR